MEPLFELSCVMYYKKAVLKIKFVYELIEATLESTNEFDKMMQMALFL